VRRAALLAVLALAACTRPTKPRPAVTPPDIKLERVTLQSYRGGETRMEVTAPVLELRRESSDFTMADATVRLPAQGLTVHAPQVAGNFNAGVLHGSGGITFATADGVTGHTERATFDRALGPQGGAVSDAGVTLQHPQFSLEASGFQVDFGTEEATFQQPVTRSR
jgi:phage baseplate assembly protein gpV